jgi:hypothetical protein
VLSKTCGLLDQKSAVTRLGGDDRLDATLSDNGMTLLAESAVGQQLENIGHPGSCTVDPVLTLTVAVKLSQDRDLGRRDRQSSV